MPYLLEFNYDESEDYSETHLERMRRKFSGAEDFESFQAGCRMNERGRVVGIGRNGCPGFNDQRICSNTIKSHRLVHWTTATMGWRMAERLFAELNTGHFCHGENLNKTEFLLRSCAAVGIDTKAAAALLDSDRYRDEVLAKINLLKSNGLDHIPLFLVDGAHIVDGAATTGKFVTLFRQLESEFKEELRIKAQAEAEAQTQAQAAAQTQGAGTDTKLQQVVVKKSTKGVQSKTAPTPAAAPPSSDTTTPAAHKTKKACINAATASVSAPAPAATVPVPLVLDPCDLVCADLASDDICCCDAASSVIAVSTTTAK